jgi:hypothetical protein
MRRRGGWPDRPVGAVEKYVGFGAAFDESIRVAIPTGAVYVAPAGVPHFLEARDGAVVYQEAGVGPTRTVWVKP